MSVIAGQTGQGKNPSGKAKASAPATAPSAPVVPAPAPAMETPSVALPSSGADLARGEVSAEEFLNRELSWLQFNYRVLNEAADERTPLLERVRFLSIFSSNLDEFIMKRVGGLNRQIDAGIVSRTPDGLTPQQQMTVIRQTVVPMLELQAKLYNQSIRPALADQGVHLLRWDQLTSDEQAFAESYFHSNIFPVLTPLAVDPGHPFPFISNLSKSLGITLRHPDSDQILFARLKVPGVLPSWVRVNNETDPQQRFVSVQDIIRYNLDDLFPEMVVLNVMPFRISRNADVEREEEDAEDLLEMIEQEVRQRRFEKVVRLEHGPNPDPWMLRFLKQELELSDEDLYELPALLDYTELKMIADLNFPQMKFSPWSPVVPAALAEDDADFFAAIRRGDMLVHHPYESFAATTERFIRAAADDPKVLAIKMTVYRTTPDSRFVQTLIRAAEAGKQVVCLVELKARFDEARNMQLAQKLEDAGIHVVYGVVGLKTHTKTTLIVRSEPDGLRCYAHIGTGNYHTETAKLYTDLGLFTCNPAITQDLVEIFHYLTGRSLKRSYRKLLVAPVNMKDKFHELIDRETANQKAGKPSQIIAKMNSMEHRGICRSLYDASRAGVSIDMIIRGFCCLRPGVKGMSENIRVMSVIGRFLEHSRIFYFRDGAADPIDGKFFIGSADWMYRNLLGRVEVITPIESRPLRERLWQILQIMLNDQRQAWDMQSDGTYVQRKPTEQTAEIQAIGTHEALMKISRQAAGPATT